MRSRPRVFFVLGSLEANDTGDEIVTILGRLPRARFEPRVIALGGREDLQGRVVRTLASGLWAAGSHTMAWHRDLEDGGLAAPGVYVLRLRTEPSQDLAVR